MPEIDLTSPESPVLLEQLGGGVARITLNRPEKRNAMSHAARTAVVEALDVLRGEPAAKVVIITGGTGPAFCAGMDLKETAAAGWRGTGTSNDRRSTWNFVNEEIARHPAIFIAAVNGVALGGGTTLVNSCDLAIAADTAQLGMPEIGFAMYPGLAGPSTQLRVTRKRAAWMVLTADRIDAATAAEWGLVNKVTTGERLQEEALELARRIAQFDPVALELSKRALWEIPDRTSDWPRALAYGEDISAQISVRTSASQTGLDAFVAGDRNPGQGMGDGAAHTSGR